MKQEIKASFKQATIKAGTANYFVNAETGEVTDYEETIEAEIVDFDRALPEGGEE